MPNGCLQGAIRWDYTEPETSGLSGAPSLKRYVVLRRSLAAAEVFHREAEGDWTFAFIPAEGRLEMPEVGVDVPLSEIYEDVEFTP